MSSFKRRILALKSLDVEYHLENEYRGEVGKDRKLYDLNLFRSVHLPFTPKECCCLCMSEGSEYIGGCCGTTSAIQDIISNCFRFNAGWIEIKDLADIFDLFESHGDGFIAFKRKALEEKVIDFKKSWKKIGCWEKMSMIWFIVKDFYEPSIPGADRRDISEVKKAIYILAQGLHSLSWDHLFDNTKGSQHKGNYIFKLSKVLPAIKTLYEEIKTLDPGTLKGYALIEKEDGKVCTNSYGLCVFNKKKEVADVFDLWRKSEQEHEEPRSGIYKDPIDDKIGIRPVKVSLENGLEFTGGLIDL